jgi:multidrug efflux pump subunit AcrA (membrane-fusion protein)
MIHTITKKLLAIARDYRSYLPARIRHLPGWQHAMMAAALVLVLLFVVRTVFSSTAPESADTGLSYVQVVAAGDLASQAKPLTVVGTIKSKSEATILAQTSGEIIVLSRSIGDRVAAGAVIGQFENASQRAAVTQAQGAYDGARAMLGKLTGTVAANTGIASAQASTAAASAASSLSTALRSAAASLDDAVRVKADVLFANPTSPMPRFASYTIPNSQLVIDIETQRSTLGTLLDSVRATAAADTTEDLDARAGRVLSDARTVQAFIDDTIAAMNQAVPNTYFSAATIAANQAALTGARSSVLAAISSVTAARSAYDAARSGAQTASNAATTGTDSDIASAQASLKSAQGALDAARANLDKTIIRSPISGTIVSLPISRGDFVPSFSQVAVVSNPGALYVEAQVTPDDARTIATGGSATIEGTVQGAITFIAPALDPATGKIQVKVGIVGSQQSLTDGEAVSVALARATKPVPIPTKKNTKANSAIAIPIVAIKVTPSGPVVFTVSASSTLAAMPVTLGAIVGERVLVSGISADLEIITDARGHTAGERVIVASSTASY